MWQLIDNRGNDDPAVNLALEEFLVRNESMTGRYMLIYRNRPSIIIGKHQNIAEEVNLKYCAQEGIPVYRRLSGGGTVYHDPGNINIAFITARSLKRVNNYGYFIQPLIRLIRRLGADAQTDRRSNILINGRKISGNAQFTSRTRMLSHGTVLYTANLHNLSRALRINARWRVESKSSKSVRSTAGNLADFLPEKRPIERFIQDVAEAYQTDPKTLSEAEWDQIYELAEKKYRTAQWNVDRSPASKIICPLAGPAAQTRIILYLRDGHIENVDFEGARLPDKSISAARESLLGLRFDYTTLKQHKTKWLAERGWPDILFA